MTEVEAIAAGALAEYGDVFRGLGALFDAAGAELFLVGGSVRDALLGRPVSDLDFTTSARPDLVQQLLSGWGDSLWDVGIEYGTVAAMRGDARVEVTTFRSDTYDGVSRNPTVKFGDSLEADLRRRDFTVNAMALRVTGDGLGGLVDPLGGLSALRAGVLDTPARPSQSFGDDPLRMLRAARFVSQLGFRSNAWVQGAIERMAPDLARISVERVQVELEKLLLGADPVAGVRLMIDTGMAGVVFPEMAWPVVLGNVVDGGSPPDLVLRLAALLSRVSPDRIVARLRALRFSSVVVQYVALLVESLHVFGEHVGVWTDGDVRRLVDSAGPVLPLVYPLARACGYPAVDAVMDVEMLLALDEDLSDLRPALDGFEIRRLLDIPGGPLVGEASRFLKGLRLDHGPMSKSDAEVELSVWWSARK